VKTVLDPTCNNGAREIDYYGALKGEEFLDGAQLVALIIVVTVVLVRVVGLYFMGLAII